MKREGVAKKTTDQPTPRPWRAVALLPDGLEHHIIAGEFRDGSAIASADNPNGLVAYADMPANAQLIVTAVNERERLRYVLSMLICNSCHNRIGWNETPTKYGDWTKCTSCREARALLNNQKEQAE